MSDVKEQLVKTKPFKNRYKFKKQWKRILSSLIAPNDIPVSLTKNVNVLFSNGEQRMARSQSELDSHLKKALVNGLQIREISVELNHKRLITDVEKQYEALIK